MHPQRSAGQAAERSIACKGICYEPTGAYTLSLNQGRLVAGDFDGQ